MIALETLKPVFIASDSRRNTHVPMSLFECSYLKVESLPPDKDKNVFKWVILRVPLLYYSIPQAASRSRVHSIVWKAV
jgi:hypothetical protein